MSEPKESTYVVGKCAQCDGDVLATEKFTVAYHNAVFCSHSCQQRWERRLRGYA